jgi:ABC-2 type transport system permease protein
MRRFGKLVALYLEGVMFYKAAFLFNLFTPLVLLGGQFLLWNALYGLSDTGVIGSYDSASMYTYLVVAFAINNLLTWGSENNLSREIRSGTIAARCMRPVPFIYQSVASMAGPMLPQAVVNFGVAGIIFAIFGRHMALPSPAGLPLAILSLILGVTLRMALASWFSLLCFYTTSHLGLSWTRRALMEFFSGALIPIAIFPDWLKTVSYCTPFPLMLQTPISLFLGEPLPLPLGVTFGLQIAWTAAFILFHELLYSRIRKNLTFAGG